MADIRKHCKDCKFCVWKNRWLCSKTNWEFNFWIGRCDEYQDKDNRD